MRSNSNVQGSLDATLAIDLGTQRVALAAGANGEARPLSTVRGDGVQARELEKLMDTPIAI